MSTVLKEEFLSNKAIYIFGVLIFAVVLLISLLFYNEGFLFALIIPLYVNLMTVLRYTDDELITLLTFPISKKTFVKSKYLINILILIICLSIGFIFIKSIDIELRYVPLLMSIICLIIGIYSIAIPLVIKSGRYSIGLRFLLFFPVLTGPFMNFFNKYLLEYLKQDVNNITKLSIIFLVITLIIYIISYTSSIKIVENKNF